MGFPVVTRKCLGVSNAFAGHTSGDKYLECLSACATLFDGKVQPNVGPVEMTRAELAERVADKIPLTKRQTEAIVGIFLECITEALREGDKAELRGFGSFRARSRKARQGRNPRTGDAVQVPAKKVPFFKAGKELREKVATVESR